MNIEALDEAAFSLLTKSLTFGDVFIITNAAEG